MDFATTMDALSWAFYNRFVKVLIDYGIVYLPQIGSWEYGISLMICINHPTKFTHTTSWCEQSMFYCEKY